jgi:hypothetical protein
VPQRLWYGLGPSGKLNCGPVPLHTGAAEAVIRRCEYAIPFKGREECERPKESSGPRTELDAPSGQGGVALSRITPHNRQERMTEKPISNETPKAPTAKVVREEFELACIREFSHSGNHLGVGVSPAERRERIRAAIVREHKANLRWQDSMWTYASAFAHAYQQPLEAGDRRAPQPWVPAEDLAWDDDVADDEEELRDGV